MVRLRQAHAELVVASPNSLLVVPDVYSACFRLSRGRMRCLWVTLTQSHKQSNAGLDKLVSFADLNCTAVLWIGSSFLHKLHASHAVLDTPLPRRLLRDCRAACTRAASLKRARQHLLGVHNTVKANELVCIYRACQLLRANCAHSNLTGTPQPSLAVQLCVEMRECTTRRRSRSCVRAAARSRLAVMCLWRSAWTSI